MSHAEPQARSPREVELRLKKRGFAWQQSQGVSMKGIVYQQDSDFYSKFSAAIQTAHLESFLQNLNGSFAIVFEDSSQVLMVVDRVRSLPLFYKLTATGIQISDEAEALLEAQPPRQQLNDEALNELRSCSYVTGVETLSRDIFQVQAGDYLRFDKFSGEITHHKYYRYPSDGFIENKSENQLIEDLHKVHQSFCKNLIDSVGDRQIVIPLSGGFDSRLIVEMLREFNYENVLCFSYGKEGNREAQIAREIAKKNGYAWTALPYSTALWKKYFHTSEKQNYYRFCSNLVSLPHMSDWPAVGELKRRKLIDPNAIIVPGMSGDFLEGRHILPVALKKQSITREEIAIGILDSHFIHWNWRHQSKAFQNSALKKVLSQLPQTDFFSPQEAMDASYCWEWRERQAKYSCNSIRAYEFWGYEWRLPLWDNSMMDYWSRIPFQHQIHRILYRKYVERFHSRNKHEAQSAQTGQLAPRLARTLPSPLKKLLKLFRVVPVYLAMKKLYSSYFDHMGVYGLFGLSAYGKLFGRLKGVTYFALRPVFIQGWLSLLLQDFYVSVLKRFKF